MTEAAAAVVSVPATAAPAAPAAAVAAVAVPEATASPAPVVEGAAPAEGEPPAEPAAPAAPTKKPTDYVAWGARLERQQTKMQRREAALQAREAEVTQAHELLAKDPLGYINRMAPRLGLDPVKLLEEANRKYLGAAPVAKTAEEIAQEASARVETLEKREKDRELAATRAQQAQAFEQAKVDFAKMVKASAAEFPYAARFDEAFLAEVAPQAARTLYARHRRDPTEKEIAKELDNYFKRQHDTLVGNQSSSAGTTGADAPTGASERGNGAVAQPAKPEAQKQARTVSNTHTAQRVSTVPDDLSDRALQEAALKVARQFGMR